MKNFKELSFYFDACSWGCVYYLGVYKSIKQYYTKKELENIKWYGTSAGSLFALAGRLNKTYYDCVKMYFNLATMAIKIGTFGKMSIFHKIILDEWLPDNGLEYMKVNNYLFIG